MAIFTRFIDNITHWCYTDSGDVMRGIDVNKPIIYQYASYRKFSPGERHIDRYCIDDVLVMVFDGVLRFTENGVSYEVKPGEYHIQRHDTEQKGCDMCESPHYLFVHFHASWVDENAAIPFRGKFEHARLSTLMDKLDHLAHKGAPLLSTSAVFYGILERLRIKDKPITLADRIVDYIQQADLTNISLQQICGEFNFSKNHIINTMKKEYGVTPIEYIQRLKVDRARYLLELTSDTAEHIALESGFSDYSNFYRVFCRIYGMSPIEWRKSKLSAYTLQ